MSSIYTSTDKHYYNRIAEGIEAVNLNTDNLDTKLDQIATNTQNIKVSIDTSNIVIYVDELESLTQTTNNKLDQVITNTGSISLDAGELEIINNYINSNIQITNEKLDDMLVDTANIDANVWNISHNLTPSNSEDVNKAIPTLVYAKHNNPHVDELGAIQVTNGHNLMISLEETNLSSNVIVYDEKNDINMTDLLSTMSVINTNIQDIEDLQTNILNDTSNIDANLWSSKVVLDSINAKTIDTDNVTVVGQPNLSYLNDSIESYQGGSWTVTVSNAFATESTLSNIDGNIATVSTYANNKRSNSATSGNITASGNTNILTTTDLGDKRNIAGACYITGDVTSLDIHVYVNVKTDNAYTAIQFDEVMGVYDGTTTQFNFHYPSFPFKYIQVIITNNTTNTPTFASDVEWSTYGNR